jgi:Neocarzinostatin family
MRQGIVRGLAVCALAVVAFAPVATAGAAGDGSVRADGGPSTPTAATPRPSAITWAQVAARLQARTGAQRARARAADPAADHGPHAIDPAVSARRAALGAAVVATPALTVTPNTGLVAGQPVTVAGTGFATGQYVVTECLAGGADPGSCDVSGAAVLTPAADGTFSSQVHLHRTLLLFPDRVDCAATPHACEMVAFPIPGPGTVVARAALDFDPNAPLPNPSITVTPSTGLLAGQQVTVTGRGFVAGDQTSVSQCAESDVFCFGEGGLVTVGADGRFSTSITVRLRVNDIEGGVTTCIAVRCVVQVGSFTNPDYQASAPLAFDPSQPVPPPPAITVTPHSGLHHNQLLTVRGTGFDPNSDI